jgi:hypothetical protein
VENHRDDARQVGALKSGRARHVIKGEAADLAHPVHVVRMVAADSVTRFRLAAAELQTIEQPGLGAKQTAHLAFAANKTAERRHVAVLIMPESPLAPGIAEGSIGSRQQREISATAAIS